MKHLNHIITFFASPRGGDWKGQILFEGWRRLSLLLAFVVGLTAKAQTRFDYFFLEAEKLRLSEDYAAAMELHRHCLDINPNAPEALYETGLLYYALRNDSLGNALLHQACNIDSCNPWYLTALASVYLERRNTKEVIPLLERLALLEPKRSDVHSQLASIYHTTGELSKAVEALNRIEHNEGVSTGLSMQKVSLYLEQQDTTQAIQELQSLCESSPHDMNILILVGSQYENMGRENEAVDYYNKVRLIDPTNEHLKFAMLSHYKKTKQDSLYLHMRDSMLFSPNSSKEMIATMMSTFIHDLGNTASADTLVYAAFDSILSRPQEDASILTMKAIYQLQSQRCSEEEFNRTMQEILFVDPNNQMALEELLKYYGRTQDLPALEEICRRGTNYYPETLPYHYYLAIALLQQDRTADACEVVQHGLERRAQDSSPELVSDMFSLLGDLLHQTKHIDECFAAYDSAMVYNPDNIMLLNNYAYYLSLRGEQLDKAEEMSYRTVRAEPNNKTYLDTYAWILFMKEDFNEARRYMERVVNPTISEDSLLTDSLLSGTVLEHAGDIYARLGMMDEALYYWNLALHRDATGSPLLRKKIKKKKYIK